MKATSRSGPSTGRIPQPMLINRIIKAVGLDPTNKREKTYDLPGTKLVLQKDLGGKPASNWFNYCSVIGILNFLTRSTRPEITFMVNQCARFMTNPRDSHEYTIYRIVRYLLGTKDKGMIIKPNQTKGSIISLLH